MERFPLHPAHPKWLADPDGEGQNNEQGDERLSDLREQVEIVEMSVV
jgi:hypothetical protein